MSVRLQKISRPCFQHLLPPGRRSFKIALTSVLPHIAMMRYHSVLWMNSSISWRGLLIIAMVPGAMLSLGIASKSFPQSQMLVPQVWMRDHADFTHETSQYCFTSCSYGNYHVNLLSSSYWSCVTDGIWVINSKGAVLYVQETCLLCDAFHVECNPACRIPNSPFVNQPQYYLSSYLPMEWVFCRHCPNWDGS